MHFGIIMKKNKSTKTNKLVLSRESLRKLTLTSDQLGKVPGGMSGMTSNFPSRP